MKPNFPRFRFSTRGMMVAVAVVGVLVAARIEGERRRARFQGIAFMNGMNGSIKQKFVDRMNDNYDENTVYLGSSFGTGRDRAAMLEDHRKARRRLIAQNEYYKAMTRKYRFASSYPWLPVTSDPPMPE